MKAGYISPMHATKSVTTLYSLLDTLSALRGGLMVTGLMVTGLMLTGPFGASDFHHSDMQTKQDAESMLLHAVS